MLEILKNRFQGNMNLHPELQWADVENRLREKPDVMEVLRKMEKSGGEPDIIIIIYDDADAVNMALDPYSSL